MSQVELQNKLKRLRGFLREALILLPLVKQGYDNEQLKQPFKKICEIIFSEDFDLHIWDEGVLLQLQKLFETKTPNQKEYGETLARLSMRTRIVQQVNGLFFSILSNEFSIEEVCQRISALVNIDESLSLKLKPRIASLKSETTKLQLQKRSSLLWII